MKFFLNIGVILSMFSFLFGCSSFGYQSPRYEQLADEITGKTAKKLKTQKGLFLIGIGGRMMDDIQVMKMSFEYYQEVDLKIGRELLVHVINEYLSAINSNEEIKPHLHEYPFTAKNVTISIFFSNPDRSKFPPGKIACISSLKGTLTYYTYSNSNFLQAIHVESYEKAVQEITLNNS